MKYRKKPIVIEAEQFRAIYERGENVYAPFCVKKRLFRRGWWVKTLEGWYRVKLGDWIIRGVNGEFYPCKPDIFDKTYEAVTPRKDE